MILKHSMCITALHCIISFSMDSTVTSGMPSIVGERECAHAKLEARTALRYVLDSEGYIYIYERKYPVHITRRARYA